MRNRRRRNRGRRLKKNSTGRNIVPRLLLLAGVILIIIFFFGDHGVYRLYEMKSRKEQLLVSINQLKNEQEELKEEQKKLLTDTTHIEDLARDLFRMALPKEKVFKTLPKSKINISYTKNQHKYTWSPPNLDWKAISTSFGSLVKV